MHRSALHRYRRSTLLTLMGACLAFIWLLPALWLLGGSVRPGSEILALLTPVTLRTFVTAHPTLDNFGAILAGQFRVGLMNSLIVAGATVVLGLAICSMAAFALSAMRPPGRNLIFAAIVFAFLIPPEVIALPLAHLFALWGLLNTYPGLVLPAVGNGIAIFLLRQFFLSIPGELVEAARVDGAGWWTIFARIYLYLAKPALISAGLLLFTSQWQAYLWPLLVSTQQNMFIAPITLAQMFGQFLTTDYGQVFAAATTLCLIPVVILLAFQRYFVQSVTISGLKE